MFTKMFILYFVIGKVEFGQLIHAYMIFSPRTNWETRNSKEENYDLSFNSKRLEKGSPPFQRRVLHERGFTFALNNVLLPCNDGDLFCTGTAPSNCTTWSNSSRRRRTTTEPIKTHHTPPSTHDLCTYRYALSTYYQIVYSRRECLVHTRDIL